MSTVTCGYVGHADVVEHSGLFPFVVHLVIQNLPVFIGKVVQAVVSYWKHVGLMRKRSGLMKRTLGVLCDKSTLLQVG